MASPQDSEASLPERTASEREEQIEEEVEAAIEEDGTGDEPEASDLEPLGPLLAMLRNRTGFDFAPYKRSSLRRRIRRRMDLQQLASLDDYFLYLQGDPGEIPRLVQDLMIGVTRFFRDQEPFELLAETIRARIHEHPNPRDGLRVWVPACATGEEAYSILIVLLEQLQDLGERIPIQIFASDIDPTALEFARRGQYPPTIAQDLTPERLKAYFHPLDGGGYEVKPEVREKVLFAQQNLIADPPFSRLDLISCRNLLIYLKPVIHDQLVQVFHFALQPGGCLLLGSSESVRGNADLFEPLSQQWRLFRRLDAQHRKGWQPPEAQPLRADRLPTLSAATARWQARARSELSDNAQGWILKQVTPPTVIVDRKGQAIYFHGELGRYLDVPSGEPTFNLIDLLREGLAIQVRGAVKRALAQGVPVTIPNARLKEGEAWSPVEIRVRPVATTGDISELALVSFAPQLPASGLQKPTETDASPGIARHLESELQSVQRDLRTTLEEMASSNKELKTSNNVVLAVNEELQSTNEELETSQEELQSVNEELTSVNQQLQEKLVELEQANNDLNNLLISSDQATLFLAQDLRILRFTPAATDLFRLRPSDRGRPLTDISRNFEDATLEADIRSVLATQDPQSAQVQSSAGRWYKRRVLPYQMQKGRVDGVVLTFSEITDLVAMTSRLDYRQKQASVVAAIGLQALRATSLQPLFDRVVETITRMMRIELCKVLELLPDGKALRLVAGVGWREGLEGTATVPSKSDSQAGYTLVAAGPVVVEDLRTEKRFSGPQLLIDHNVISGISVIIQGAEQPFGVLGAHSTRRIEFSHEDVVFLQMMANTLGQAIDHFQARAEIERRAALSRREAAELDTVYQQTPIGLAVFDHELRYLRINERLAEINGFPAAEHIGQRLTEMLPEVAEQVAPLIEQVLATGDAVSELELATSTPRDGEFTRRYLCSFHPVFLENGGSENGASKGGTATSVITVVQDITERWWAQRRIATERAVARVLAGSSSLDEAIPGLLQSITEVLDLRVCEFWLVDSATNELLFKGFHFPEDPADESPEGGKKFTEANWVRPGADLATHLYQDGSDLHWIADLSSADNDFSMTKEIETLGLTSGLAFSIRLDGQLIAVMSCMSCNLQRADPELAEMLGSLGTDIGEFVRRSRTERALRRTEERLRVADYRKDEFLAVLSHELRNPLAAIDGGVKLLQRQPEDLETCLWVSEMMDHQVVRMNHLVDDLLEVTRIARGKIILRRKPVLLARLIAHAQTSVARLIEQQEHTLIVGPVPQEVVVDVDPIRIEQVIVNLLANAAKFTPRGGEIKVETELKGERIRLSVTDSGRGLRQQDIEVVFEPFMQIGSAPSSESGLGVGLTLARQLVELHGGRIEAHSAGPGEGSTFTFTLPVAQEGSVAEPLEAEELGDPLSRRSHRSLVPPASKNSRRPPPLVTEIPQSGRKILVVDDNISAAQGLATLLTSEGYRTETAFDAEQALRVAGELEPEIGLLDIALPGVDGYQLARQLREQFGEAITLIAVTGFGHAEARTKTAAAGFDHHLLKPVSFDSLLELLAESGSRTVD